MLAALFGIPRLYEARRRRTYAAFCSSRGYDYVPERRDATAPYADLVEMFRTGRNHGWRDEIAGVFNGRQFRAFEYQYVAGDIRTRFVFSRAMIHWRLGGGSLPHFVLVPSSSHIVGRDPRALPFPEDPAFTHAYMLTGEDEAALRELFAAELRAALTRMPGQFVAAAQTGDVFWWQERRLPRPEAFDMFLSEGSRVLELFAKR